MINPSHAAFPAEANLIGLMVLGYSELDITLCFVGGLALGQKWAVLSALHALDNESARLDMVNRLVKHVMIERGIDAKFGEAIGAMRHCKKIRNQYAHAQWIDRNNTLMFASAKDIPWKADGVIQWKVTNFHLLQKQKAYFEYTRKCLIWLEAEFSMPHNPLQWPPHMRQPPKQVFDAAHNGPLRN